MKSAISLGRVVDSTESTVIRSEFLNVQKYKVKKLS